MRPAIARPLLRRLACGLALLLAACGFQLRGVVSLPFATLHIGLPESSELHAVIKRNVEASSATRVVSEAKDAAARLLVTANSQAKTVLSTNSAGQVREFELTRTFVFSVNDRDNRVLLPTSQIVIRRDITYSDAQVLSKESEEGLLWRDMQNDLVQQLLRRLSTIKPRAS